MCSRRKKSSYLQFPRKLSLSFYRKCGGDSSVLEAVRFLGARHRMSLLLMEMDSSFSPFAGRGTHSSLAWHFSLMNCRSFFSTFVSRLA